MLFGGGMETALTLADLELLIESLDYSRFKVESYEDYPLGYRQTRLEQIKVAVAKVRAMRKAAKLAVKP
jgi:hypothetical protein